MVVRPCSAVAQRGTSDDTALGAALCERAAYGLADGVVEDARHCSACEGGVALRLAIALQGALRCVFAFVDWVDENGFMVGFLVGNLLRGRDERGEHGEAD